MSLRDNLRRGILLGRNGRQASAPLRNDTAGKGIQWNAGNWVDSDAPGNRYSSGGRGASSVSKFASAAGDPWNNAVWSACHNYAARNLAQAPPLVLEQSAASRRKWEEAKDQSAADLMLSPTTGAIRDGRFDGGVSFYGWREMVSAILLSLHAGNDGGGNAYIAIDTDAAGYPARLWWLPHWKVKPITDRPTTDRPASGNLIDRYEYWVNGEREYFDLDEIIHIRFGIDPHDPRLGMSACRAADTGIYTLNQSGEYAAYVLRNHGSTSLYFTPKEYSKDSPFSDIEFDPKTFVDDYQQAHSRGNVAKVGAYEIPLDITKLNLSPQEMALDTMPDRSEAEVCALWGFPTQVIGVLSGRLQQSRANLTEAREVAWEETLLPLAEIIADAFTVNLLPKMRGYKPTPRRKIQFDTTDIRPLQPDRDKRDKRVKEAFEAGIIDRFEARLETDREARPEDKDVWYSGGGLMEEEIEDEETDEAGTETEDAEDENEAKRRNGFHNGNGTHKNGRGIRRDTRSGSSVRRITGTGRKSGSTGLYGLLRRRIADGLSNPSPYVLCSEPAEGNDDGATGSVPRSLWAARILNELDAVDRS